MRVVALSLVSLLLCCFSVVDVYGAVPRDAVYSSAILSGNTFIFPAWNTTNLDKDGRAVLLVTNQANGELLNGPELQVVSGTTVYFNISAIFLNNVPLAFGLSVSNSSVISSNGKDGDDVGLIPTPESVLLGSCTGYTTENQNFVKVNTFARNFTLDKSNVTFVSSTACVLQWTVPAPNDTKYYYFEPRVPSLPRQIHIVAGSDNNNTTPSPPTPSGTPSSTPTPTGVATPTPTGAATPTPTIVPTPTPTTPPGTGGSGSSSAHVGAWTVAAVVTAIVTVAWRM